MEIGVFLEVNRREGRESWITVYRFDLVFPGGEFHLRETTEELRAQLAEFLGCLVRGKTSISALEVTHFERKVT